MKHPFIACAVVVAAAFAFTTCTKRVVEPTFKIAETEMVGGPYWQLHDICFIDESTGILFYDYQSLMKTTDGGLTWTEIFAAPQGQLTAFAYPQRDTIYAFTQVSWTDDHDVHRSTDGGATWTIVSQVGDEVLPAFFNGKTGFAMSSVVPSNQTRLIRTINAGVTWTNVGTYDDQTTVMGFVSPLNGYTINGANQFLRTTDGGVNWTITATNFSYITRMTSDGVAYAYRIDEGILKTTDYGATWTLLLPESTDQTLFGHMDVRGQTIVVIHNQNLEVSQDGGATWNTYIVKAEQNNFDFRMFDVYITDAAHVLIYERPDYSNSYNILLRATLQLR